MNPTRNSLEALATPAATPTVGFSHWWSMPLIAVGAVWIWTHFCAAPWSHWNDLRLGPTLMAAHGINPFASANAGILTTWLYGPVPLWAWWPATLGPDAVSAVLISLGLNAAFTVSALACACRWWPQPVPPGIRWFAFGLCLTLLPAGVYEYLLADNLAVATGLGANTLLALQSDKRNGSRPWLAAALTAASLGCKQTLAPLVIAQCLYLGLAAGPRVALGYFVRVIAAGALLITLLLLQFGFAGPWFSMVVLPGHLPWAADSFARIGTLLPQLLVLMLAPIGLMILFPDSLGRRHPLRLALFSWLVLLPLDWAGFLRVGGSLNSFHGLSLLLPPAALFIVARFAPSFRRVVSIGSAAAIGVVALTWLQQPHRPLRPLVFPFRQAAEISRNFRGQIWFPWNPTVAFYATGKFFHTEDGWFARELAGKPVSQAHLRQGLPLPFRYIAMTGENWQLAQRLADPRQPAMLAENSPWTLYPAASWLSQ